MRFSEFLKNKRQSYKIVFNPEGASQKVVLADLRKFCRGTGSKFMGDSEKTLVMVGRNEVWERIQSYLNIPESELAKFVENNDE